MAQKTKKGALVIDVAPENPEAIAVQLDANSMTAFFGGLKAFLTRAQSLEATAKGTLATAKTLVMPQDGGQDAAIQTFVRRAKEDRKAVEDHWQITSLIHRFHKRLVSARTRATDPLDQAEAIGNNLHNRYRAEAERKAREEERRREAEAQAEAQREREKVLAEYEAEALRKESESGDLSEREEQFVRLVASGVNSAKQAAITVGYRDANMGAKLLDKPKIAAAIQAIVDAVALRKQAEAVKAMPLVIEQDTSVSADVVDGGDRTTKTAELLDPQAFIEAVLSQKYGIPLDVLEVSQARLNAHARSLGELINRWPGVKLKKTTRIV